jgi:Putative endonuclease segE, GIY-YIG domain
MNYGHWEFPHEFDVDEWFGFIYRITELDTNRLYLGKKQFSKYRRKKIKGRKNRKKIVSSSDWEVYTGSSVELNAQIALKGKHNYRFEIVSLHKTRGSLHYAEVRAQITEDVLRVRFDDGTRKYYNKIINATKFFPPEEHPQEKLFRI